MSKHRFIILCATLIFLALAMPACNLNSNAAPPPTPTPGPPVVIASGQNQIRGLAADETNLYWTDCGTEANHYLDSAVKRMPKAGGTPTVLAGGQQCPEQLMVDSTSVYWVNHRNWPNDYDSSFILLKTSKQGGQSVELARDPADLISIGMDETDIYWTSCELAEARYTNGSVVKLSKAGGPAEIIATGQICPGSLGITATHLYWVSDGNIMQMPKDGDTISVLVEGADQLLVEASIDRTVYVDILLVDNANIYWTAYVNNNPSGYHGCADEHTAILEIPLSGGAPTRLVSASGRLRTLTQDEENLYWAGDCGGPARVAKSGGSVVELYHPELYPEASHVSNMIVDAGNIYWSDYQEGTLVRASKMGQPDR